MPYNFSAQSTGLTYLGPFIAAFLAMLLVGPLTDFSARVLSKRNHGIFEPEFRLTPIVLYLFFGILGFVGYGWTLQDGTPWIGPVMFFSISNFGVVMGSTAGISYVIDSHRHSADAALGSLIFWKNIWSFSLTWNLVDQIIQYGTRDVFAIVAALIAFACLTTIPIWIFGKRLRSWTFRTLNFGESETSVVSH